MQSESDCVKMLNIPFFLSRSEVGQVFALSWLITWYGHVLKDFSTIVRLYDFFLATHPLMPVYFGAAVSLFSFLYNAKEDCIFYSMYVSGSCPPTPPQT